MDIAERSIGQLKTFVEKHDLMDRYSVTQFNAIVTIGTEHASIEKQEMKVGITFDDSKYYATVSLLESDIDPYAYPTVFYAKYQIMEYIDGVYLKISGNHMQNPKIGKYQVKIVPLKRLRD